MMKHIVTVLLAGFCASHMNAQTTDDLTARYKKLDTYELRPGIMMTASFAPDGQVCEMIIQKNHHVADDNIDLGSTISAKIKDELINELVPEETRGGKTNDGWLDGVVAGGTFSSESSYENVSIQEVGEFSDSCESGTELVVVRWKRMTCSWKSEESRENGDLSATSSK